MKGSLRLTQSRQGRKEDSAQQVNIQPSIERSLKRLEWDILRRENKRAYSHPQLCPFPTRCSCIELALCGIFAAIMLSAVSEAKP